MAYQNAKRRLRAVGGGPAEPVNPSTTVDVPGNRSGYASQEQGAALFGEPLAVGEAQTDRQRVNRFKRWWSDSQRTFELWRALAIESYQFCGGDQWSAADQKRLLELERPMLVINKILGPVLFLAGVQRQSRTEPTILPFESGDDRPAEIMQALLKWVATQSHEDVIDSQVFMDKIVAGLGWWKCRVDYETDPAGTPIWERVHPLSVYPDPQFLDYGWEAASYVIHAYWMTRDEALDEFPQFRDAIDARYGEWLTDTGNTTGQNQGTAESTGDSLSGQRQFWDPVKQRARILEIWYKRRVQVEVAINTQSGEVEGDPDAVASLRERFAQFPTPEVQFVKRPVRIIRRAQILDEILLEDEDSPYDAPDFPLFPSVGYYFWQRPFGVVEVMKDPQREKNRRRSTIIEMVQKMPASGFLNHRTNGAKTEDIENFASGNGSVINYENEIPHQIKPPDLPQAVVFLEQKSDEEVRDTVNVTRELLGQTTQRTVSGRAIEARQRSGLTTQEPLLESFRQDKRRAVEFMVKVIQQYVPVGRAMRILGTIAVRNPMMPVASMVQQNPAMEVEQVLNTAMFSRFDIIIDTDSKAWEPSVKMAMFDTLKELAQTFAGAIPPDVLAEAARDAGLISEDQAARITAFVQQQMQQVAAAHAVPGPGGAAGAPAKSPFG